jgi:hypothetical protein
MSTETQPDQTREGGAGGAGEGVSVDELVAALERVLDLQLVTISEEELEVRYDLRDIIGEYVSGVVWCCSLSGLCSL